jgi:hypothetical protein
MKKLHLLLLFLPLYSFAQQTIQVGTGTQNDYDNPFYGLWDYSQEMFIIDEADLGAQMINIEMMEFELHQYTDGYTFNDITIKIAHTSTNEFENGVQIDLTGVNYSDLTTCLSGHDLVIDRDGWFKFAFSTAFLYKGSGNLLVIIENRDGSWQSGYGYTETTILPQNKSWKLYQDDFYPTEDHTGTAFNYRPNFRFRSSGNNPLPVNLLSFDAELVSDLNESVNLTWSTATEQNNDFFTISRSIDGVYWENIASISGSGNSNSQLNYGYIDRMLPLLKNNTQTIYYRLSQTDFDGEREFFDPIAISRMSSLENPNLIRVSNIMGQEVGLNEKGVIIKRYDNGEVIKVYNP